MVIKWLYFGFEVGDKMVISIEVINRVVSCALPKNKAALTPVVTTQDNPVNYSCQSG